VRAGCRVRPAVAALAVAAAAVIVAAALVLPSGVHAVGGDDEAPSLAAGALVYAQNCNGCHGPKGLGDVGPSLLPAGSASIVAGMVEEGGFEMPPFGSALDSSQIAAVSEYVAADLAAPEARTADIVRGGELYRLYCAGCHSATGRGGALAKGRNAPDISLHPAGQSLAAMIIGRRGMSAFAGNTFDVGQQAAVSRYVEMLVEPPSPGGHGLGYYGPVTEGFAAAGGLLVLIALAVWLAWKSREEPE
jgi:ubiquinol-cytochrome c reductase cytochrome c subunit